MNGTDAIVLGLVQGIAEFLPISSTGHLILARDVLGIQTPDGLAVDAVLQLATALAVIMYFWRDLWGLAVAVFNIVQKQPILIEQRTMIIALVLGTIPAVIGGLFLEHTMETLFRNPHLVAAVLIAGSILFLVAEQVNKRYVEVRTLTVGKGVAIGFFQTLALVPGMSRSGATISGGMLLGLSREAAARFAFLLSVPIILGSGMKKLLELGSAHTPASEWQMIAFASVIAFVSGIASIHFLLKYLRTHSLNVFVVYRVALAILVLALL